MEIAGHIIGFIAILIFFISYQVYDKRRLLFIQTVATALICLQYILIGAYSGFALNLVCIGRNLAFYHKDKSPLWGRLMPYIFTLIMGGMGILSWEGYHSLLIISGLMINTLCMGLCSTQGLRKSILITCPIVIVYNAFARSYSGILSESISFTSALIGLIRFRRKEK